MAAALCSALVAGRRMDVKSRLEAAKRLAGAGLFPEDGHVSPELVQMAEEALAEGRFDEQLPAMVSRAHPEEAAAAQASPVSGRSLGEVFAEGETQDVSSSSNAQAADDVVRVAFDETVSGQPVGYASDLAPDKPQKSFVDAASAALQETAKDIRETAEDIRTAEKPILEVPAQAAAALLQTSAEMETEWHAQEVAALAGMEFVHYGRRHPAHGYRAALAAKKENLLGSLFSSLFGS